MARNDTQKMNDVQMKLRHTTWSTTLSFTLSLLILVLSTTVNAHLAEQSETNRPIFTREQLLEKANADYEAADKRFKQQIAEPNQYTPCDAEYSYFERSYAEWYLQNEAEIWTRYHSLESVIQYAHKKALELKSLSFQPIVIKGQQQDPNITFNTVLQYLSDLAIRKKSAHELGQLSVFEDHLTRPEFNPFHLTLNQIVESLQAMSEQMNASLKDQGVEFKILFQNRLDGYGLHLKVKISGPTQMLLLDLLNSGQTFYTQDADRWKSLANDKIGPYSIDATRRYQEWWSEAKSKLCLARIWTGLSHLNDSLPYLPLKEINFSQKDVLSKVAFSKDTLICDWGGVGTIEIGYGQARLIKWGYSNGPWPSEPIRLSSNGGKLEIRYSNSYSQVWVDADGNGSHGPVTCRMK
jgi:hypothetical protein